MLINPNWLNKCIDFEGALVDEDYNSPLLLIEGWKLLDELDNVGRSNISQNVDNMVNLGVYDSPGGQKELVSVMPIRF